MHFLRNLGSGLLFLVSMASISGAAAPNIVFIMADDLGYGELGCYGQQVMSTPHLDQMAQEGMRFTHFYAGATVCAPSRNVFNRCFQSVSPTLRRV